MSSKKQRLRISGAGFNETNALIQSLNNSVRTLKAFLNTGANLTRLLI